MGKQGTPVEMCAAFRVPTLDSTLRYRSVGKSSYVAYSQYDSTAPYDKNNIHDVF